MLDAHRKRFWKSADVSGNGAGYSILLDGRPLRTPAKSEFLVPSRPLADEIAREWGEQGDKINPEAMPFTRLANSAIDKVAPQKTAVADMLGAYGETDLLCYLAPGPEELLARQTALWQPWLDWARAELNAPLNQVAGVMFIDQPDASLSRLRAELDRFSSFELAAVHDLITLSGSLVLALATAAKALPADDAWPLSRLDELWQIEQWGPDEEAETLSARKQAEFLRAARTLDLLGTGH